MKRRIAFICLAAIAWCNAATWAQTDITMMTHWFSRASYNPASIARPNYLYLFSNARQQWTGIQGAPSVINVQASQYVHDMQSAFGFTFVSDRLGATQSLNPMLTYARQLTVSNASSLSLGLSMGVAFRSVNSSLLEAETETDPAIPYNDYKETKPDANVGVEYQTTHWIIGLSSTHLFAIGKPDSLFSNTNHLYASVIYKNTRSPKINYHFGIQLISRENLSMAEAKACVRFKHQTGLIGGPREVFMVGMAVRSSNQLSLLTGVNITSDIRIGYAYDQSFRAGYYNHGTHELMLEYRLPSKAAFNRRYHDEGFWYN